MVCSRGRGRGGCDTMPASAIKASGRDKADGGTVPRIHGFSEKMGGNLVIGCFD